MRGSHSPQVAQLARRLEEREDERQKDHADEEEEDHETFTGVSDAGGISTMT